MCRCLEMPGQGRHESTMGPSRLGVRRRRAGARHRCHYRADSPFATSRARSTVTTRVARKLAPEERTGAKTVEHGEGRSQSDPLVDSFPYVLFDDNPYATTAIFYGILRDILLLALCFSAEKATGQKFRDDVEATSEMTRK